MAKPTMNDPPQEPLAVFMRKLSQSAPNTSAFSGIARSDEAAKEGVDVLGPAAAEEAHGADRTCLAAVALGAESLASVLQKRYTVMLTDGSDPSKRCNKAVKMCDQHCSGFGPD